MSIIFFYYNVSWISCCELTVVWFVQIVNSVVMNHVSIADGCSIQGSIICSNVQLQERAALKDCQVTKNIV